MKSYMQINGKAVYQERHNDVNGAKIIEACAMVLAFFFSPLLLNFLLKDKEVLYKNLPF